MLTRVILVVVGTCGLIGCHSEPLTFDSREGIQWAEHRIECQRAVKRHLLHVDPIERQIESKLNADSRVASARFAITIASYGICGPSDFEPLTCTTVIRTREAMSEPEERTLVVRACAGAGMTMDFAHFEHAEDAWAVSYATLRAKGQDNRDLSRISSPPP